MSKDWLPKEDYLPYASASVGEQVRVNHDSCEAGADTKRRLYIRRTDDAVLAFCHHCGKRGYDRTTDFSGAYVKERIERRVENSVVSGDSHGENIKAPYDATTTIADWPPEARVWIGKYGITQEEVRNRGIFYSEKVARIGLPNSDMGKLVGIQYRKIHKKDEGPKYYSVGKTQPFVLISPLSSSKLMIVEDMLSAIKCARVCDTVCLHGTYLDDATLLQIVKKYTYAYIWLDNDNADVKIKQIAISNKLAMYGVSSSIVKEGDPKCLNTEEIKEILT